MIAAPALAGALGKDFDDAVATVHRLSHQQLAKCEMEAAQYGDEHPLDVSGLSDDQIMSLAGGGYADRIDLCMEAAGWPTLLDNGLLGVMSDTHRRARELWVKSRKSQSDLEWFDEEDRYLKCVLAETDEKVLQQCMHLAFDTPE